MKADIEAALVAAKVAGHRIFIHSYCQVGGEFAASDLTAGEKGLIGRDGTFIPYRQVAQMYPVPKPGRKSAKETK